MQRSRQKGTILGMHNIATGLESYKGESIAVDFAANVPTLSGVTTISATTASFLVPMHLNVQPNVDRWGTPFAYTSQATGEWMVWFISAGKDTAATATVADRGEYQVTQLSDFENDIIFIDGQMSYGPNTTGTTST